MAFEIKIQIKGRVFALTVGHKAEWFDQLPFLMIAEEWYKDMEVCYAKHMWDSRNIWAKLLKTFAIGLSLVFCGISGWMIGMAISLYLGV